MAVSIREIVYDTAASGALSLTLPSSAQAGDTLILHTATDEAEKAVSGGLGAFEFEYAEAPAGGTVWAARREVTTDDVASPPTYAPFWTGAGNRFGLLIVVAGATYENTLVFDAANFTNDASPTVPATGITVTSGGAAIWVAFAVDETLLSGSAWDTPAGSARSDDGSIPNYGVFIELTAGALSMEHTGHNASLDSNIFTMLFESSGSLAFTPTTTGIRINPDTVEKQHGGRAGIWRHYGTPIQVGYSVLITGGVATASPGKFSPTADEIAAADSGSGEGGKAWFRGGITYTLTAAEKTILEAAGYTVGS